MAFWALRVASSAARLAAWSLFHSWSVTPGSRVSTSGVSDRGEFESEEQHLFLLVLFLHDRVQGQGLVLLRVRVPSHALVVVSWV